MWLTLRVGAAQGRLFAGGTVARRGWGALPRHLIVPAVHNPGVRSRGCFATQTSCSRKQLRRLQRRRNKPLSPSQAFAFPALRYLRVAGDLPLSPEPFSFPWELQECRQDPSKPRGGFSGPRSRPLTAVLAFSLLRGLMSPSTRAQRRTWSLNSSWRRLPRPLGPTTTSTRRAASSRTQALKLPW